MLDSKLLLYKEQALLTLESINYSQLFCLPKTKAPEIYCVHVKIESSISFLVQLSLDPPLPELLMLVIHLHPKSVINQFHFWTNNNPILNSSTLVILTIS